MVCVGDRLTGRSFLSFALFYLFMVVFLRVVLYTFVPQLSWAGGWTATLVLHFVVRRPCAGGGCETCGLLFGAFFCRCFVWAQLSFFILHQSKGVPMWMYQGQYDDQTFWEQLDGGKPWTKARKMLMVIPMVLYVGWATARGVAAVCSRTLTTAVCDAVVVACRSIITAHATEYATGHLVLNVVLTGVLIVAKLPEMQGVRLFGQKRMD